MISKKLQKKKSNINLHNFFVVESYFEHTLLLVKAYNYKIIKQNKKSKN